MLVRTAFKRNWAAYAWAGCTRGLTGRREKVRGGGRASRPCATTKSNVYGRRRPAAASRAPGKRPGRSPPLRSDLSHVERDVDPHINGSIAKIAHEIEEAGIVPSIFGRSRVDLSGVGSLPLPPPDCRGLRRLPVRRPSPLNPNRTFSPG